MTQMNKHSKSYYHTQIDKYMNRFQVLSRYVGGLDAKKSVVQSLFQPCGERHATIYSFVDHGIGIFETGWNMYECCDKWKP